MDDAIDTAFGLAIIGMIFMSIQNILYATVLVVVLAALLCARR